MLYPYGNIPWGATGLDTVPVAELGIETLIWRALRNRLNEIVFEPALPIAWPNQAFEPPAETYLKVDLLWNRPISRGISPYSTTERRGIFQVTVVAKANIGFNTPTNIASAIARRFARRVPIVQNDVVVRFEGEPSHGPSLQTGDRLRTALSVRFYTFA